MAAGNSDKQTADHIVSGGVTEQAAEGDDWREAGEVEEDKRCQALDGRSILEVAEVERNLPGNVIT